ncbi:MAG: hypothetical protein ACM3RP_02915 [Chitinophagales bacterium]
MIGLVLAVALAGAAWEALTLAGISGYARLQLQNGLDAGATAGAAVLADGINAVAALNGVLLALGIPAMMGQGAAAAAARKIQALQDQTIRLTPALAQGEACAAAMTSGATVAFVPAHQGEKWPGLMLKRVYFLPELFGHAFPLWVSDNLRRTAGRRWGDRVIFLEGWTLAGRGALRAPLQATAGAAASCTGGGASSFPLLWPRYSSRLIPSGKKAAER